MAADGVWMEFENLHLFDQDPLECGTELRVGKESRNRPEARGESKSLDFKPSLTGSSEDIYHGAKIGHIFTEQCVA